MMTHKTLHRSTWLAPCLAALALGVLAAAGTALAADDTANGAARKPAPRKVRVTPPEELVVEVPPEVKAVLSRKAYARKVDLDGTGILWMTGSLGQWGTGDAEAIRKWVATGHVAWVDMHLAGLFGAIVKLGAGVEDAVVAPGAEGHPLVEGVKSVLCADAFEYVRDMPKGSQAILTLANCSVHAVVFIWPVGKGVIVFRPEQRGPSVDWTSYGQRRWIEPDMADGRQFLANLSTYSLQMLRDAGWVAPAVETTSRGRTISPSRRDGSSTDPLRDPEPIRVPLRSERGPQPLGAAFHIPGEL
jgi:hypothetical protein